MRGRHKYEIDHTGSVFRIACVLRQGPLRMHSGPGPMMTVLFTPLVVAQMALVMIAIKADNSSWALSLLRRSW